MNGYKLIGMNHCTKELKKKINKRTKRDLNYYGAKKKSAFMHYHA